MDSREIFELKKLISITYNNAGLKNTILRIVLDCLSRSPFLPHRRKLRFSKSSSKRSIPKQSEIFEKIESISEKITDLQRASYSVAHRIWVTAIIPNYNHAPYLKARIESILNQTYPFINILILDDNSTDGSHEIISRYVEKFPNRISYIRNNVNSGSVFKQWRKGFDAASGDLVWICESDDYCELDFVEKSIAEFSDSSTLISFGRIQFCDEMGREFDGLDHYRNSAENGIWDRKINRPANEWFSGAFSIKNIIPNVSGCLIRKQQISNEIWEKAASFKVMGDWYLYLRLSHGGTISYVPDAVSYFRQHNKNTSGINAMSRDGYYIEYVRIMKEILRTWDVPERTISGFKESVMSVAKNANISIDLVEDMLSKVDAKTETRENIHVAIAFLGFSLGGGEIFPIELANYLKSLGVTVSMIQYTRDADDDLIRDKLDSGIAVYTTEKIKKNGGLQYLLRMGVDVIHSHMAHLDSFLIDELQVDLPYVVTLHGSYEAIGLPEKKVSAWADSFDRVVYLAEKNLIPFGRINTENKKFIKMPNAVHFDERASSITRADLGADDNSIIFTLVSRAIKEKGWDVSIAAFLKVKLKNPHQSIKLVLAGDGPDIEYARRIAEGDPDIHILGFVDKVHGLYKISDVAILPTRFSGESYPLTIIQALQCGKPIIATDIGQIKYMISDESPSGILLDIKDNEDEFIDCIYEAMTEMLDADFRKSLASKAVQVGEKYSMKKLSEEYLKIYADAIKERKG